MDIPTDKIGRVRTQFLCIEGTRELDHNKMMVCLPHSFTLTIRNLFWKYPGMSSSSEKSYEDYTNWIIENNSSGWYQTKKIIDSETTTYTFYFNNPNDAALFRLFHGDEIK